MRAKQEAEEEKEKENPRSEHKCMGGWVTLPLRRGKPFVCMEVLVVGGTT